MQAIIKKWKTALVQRAEMKSAVDDLTDRISEEWIVEWTALEEKAMEQRGEFLRIYDVAETKGMP